MDAKILVKEWFEKWEAGDFLNLPISEQFKHTSPFGTISGKKQYLDLVQENREKFLGYRFEILDALYEEEKACVRYRGVQGEFVLDVSEWYYLKNALIDQVIAYYHIGDIREERQLENPIGMDFS